jgi:hypothetical protein
VEGIIGRLWAIDIGHHLCLCFWFSVCKPPSRSWTVEMWESRAFSEISKGRWEGWESRFCFSTLSTAPPFPQSSVVVIVLWTGPRLGLLRYSIPGGWTGTRPCHRLGPRGQPDSGHQITWFKPAMNGVRCPAPGQACRSKPLPVNRSYCGSTAVNAAIVSSPSTSAGVASGASATAPAHAAVMPAA